MMTTMAALLAGLPLALGTGSVPSCAGRSASPWSADCLSQAFTLYTTPVIYIFFDNLAQRFAGHRGNRIPEMRNRQDRHEHFRAFYSSTGRDHLAHRGNCPSRSSCISGATSIAAARC